MYMLDTNIVSDAIKNPDGETARRIAGAEHAGVTISIVVAAELTYGLAKRNAPVQQTRFADLLMLVSIVALDRDADDRYARLRADLERNGKAIGANDMFIAAHAMALGATLVTDDSDFDRIEGLLTENWLRG